MRLGGRSLVFRGRPPRLEPLPLPPAPAGMLPLPPPVDKAGKPLPDLSDPVMFSMPPVEGVRDVNEVY